MKTYIITMSSGAKHQIITDENGKKDIDYCIINKVIFQHGNLFLNSNLIEAFEEVK